MLSSGSSRIKEEAKDKKINNTKVTFFIHNPGYLYYKE
jgi:hypothetical protein